MTSITTSETTTVRLHPVLAGVVGAVTFGVAMYAGEALDLNADAGGDTAVKASEWLITAALALVGLAVAVGLGMRGWAGPPARLSHTAIGLALAGAATFVVFWSGWPSVFSAVAIGLALEHRRRIGSFSAATGSAAALGVLTFVATTYICVVG